MKNLLFVFIFVLIFSPVQADDPLDLQTHPWSVQFKVTSDYLVSSFDNKAFSVKKQISPNSAYRLSFTPSFRDESVTSIDAIVYDTSGVITENLQKDNYKNSSIGMVVDFLYIKQIVTSHPIYPYLGVGPMVSYSKTETTREDNNSLNKSTRFGGIILFGLEFRFKKQFGLFAEYQSEAYYYKTTREQERTRTVPNGINILSSIDETSGYRWYNSTVSMGLSVYF